MSNSEFRNFFEFINRLKAFFNGKDFLEVQTPQIVQNPGIEPHIHPFQIHSTAKKETLKYYLHSSPEFWMKKLLSEDDQLNKIYNLSFSFRDEPISDIHRSQFLMLEWYRSEASYESIMDDCIELIQYLDVKNKFKKPLTITVNELFKKTLDIEILDYLEKNSLINLINKSFPEIHLPQEELSWDDYFFLLFLNKIEPELKKHPFMIIKEYPYHLSALSKISNEDSRVCERFEIYLNGIELANCFHELCDLEIQRQRFSENNNIKKAQYGYELPEPDMLFKSLEQGLPSPSGIALGVERLYSIMNDKSFFLSNH